MPRVVVGADRARKHFGGVEDRHVRRALDSARLRQVLPAVVLVHEIGKASSARHNFHMPLCAELIVCFPRDGDNVVMRDREMHSCRLLRAVVAPVDIGVRNGGYQIERFVGILITL